MIFEIFSTILIKYRAVAAALMVGMTVFAIYGHRYERPLDEPSSDSLSSAAGADANEAADNIGRRPAPCLLVVEVDDLFTPKTVAAMRDVAAAVKALKQVEEVQWVDTIPRLNVFGLREPLLPNKDASAERYEQARRETLEHPLVEGQLLSDDGKTLLMPVTFNWLYVTSDEDCVQGVVNAARSAAAKHPDAHIKRIRATGRAPLLLAYEEAFRRNESQFQIIAYVMSFLFAVIMFRSVRAVLIVGVAPALGVFWALGVLNWLDELTNPLTTVVLPVLLTMVGLTDGVHLMVHINRGRAEGLSSTEAARSAIRHVGAACALTSLTTAIGFGSLLIARSEFVQTFGRACAIGVVITFFAVVTTIPLICTTWIGRSLHRGRYGDIFESRFLRLDGVIDVVLRRYRWVTFLAIASTLLLGVIALQLRPDSMTKHQQPTGSEAYQALMHCDEALGGIEFIHATIRWPTSLSDNSPQILRAIEDAQAVFDSEPLIHHSLSIREFLSVLPGDTDLLGRMSMIALLPQSVKDAYFDEENRQARVRARVQDLGIAKFEPIFAAVARKFEQLEKKHPGFDFELGGQPVQRSRELYKIVTDLTMSLGAASAIIFAVMALVYRSIRIGLISVVPNMFPLAVTASMLVVLGQPLTIAKVCSFTVCLGIAVDDTIHYLTRFQEERRSGLVVEDALRRAFLKVATAMVMTTVILVAGFGTVMSSDLPSHRSFAAMACSTIGAALVGDLIFLPAMLKFFSRRESNRKTSPNRGDVNEPARG